MPDLAADVLEDMARVDCTVFSEGPDQEVRLTAGGALCLSGEPYPYFDSALIYGGVEPEARMREFTARIAERRLPAIVVVGTDLLERTRPVAAGAGLVEAGTMPVMAYDRTEAPPPAVMRSSRSIREP